ncbi:MAG: DNA-binding protein [Candidatus Lokiarchaeota archaeon]|nr:DNA-binding protein [Candidatus Lokiarchaeota archaeon]
MKLVIDANIIFAALIKGGLTAELIISNELQLFAPEFLLEEFSKYQNQILEKTHRSKENFGNFVRILKEYITFIPQKNITPFLEKANAFSPDPKDSVYLALALALKSAVWSNDKKLKNEQNHIKVLSTEDLIKKINIFKKNK